MSEAVLRRFVAQLITHAHARRLPVAAVTAMLQTLADLPAPGSPVVGDIVLDVLYPRDGELHHAATMRRVLAEERSGQRARELLEEADELERRARDRGDVVPTADELPIETTADIPVEE